MKIFVAGPFNHPDQNVKDARVRAIAEYCVRMFNEHKNPISALLMGLSFAAHGNLSTDTKTWETFSGTMVRGCDELHVLMMEGWEESSGVKLEIEIAQHLGIPVRYIECFLDTDSVEITTYMQENGLVLREIVRKDSGISVYMESVDVKVLGGYQSYSGDGKTVDAALKHYCERISGKKICINYGTPFKAPKFIHTKLLGR